MIVPSMNLDELKKEIDKDHAILFRKSVFVGHQLEREYRLKSNERKKISYDYFSKHKNNWVYFFDITKNNTVCSFMIYYYSDRGLNAFLKLDDNTSFVFFSAHFFTRYNERLKLNYTSPKQMIHYFISNNTGFIFQKIDMIDNTRYKFFCKFKDGIALGTMDLETKIYKMNTFITQDMLFGDQQDLNDNLNKQLDKYLQDSKILV